MAETLLPPPIVMPKQEQPADAAPTPNAATIAPPLPTPVVPVRYDAPPTTKTAPLPTAPEPETWQPTPVLQWNGTILEQEWYLRSAVPPEPNSPLGLPTVYEELYEWRVVPGPGGAGIATGTSFTPTGNIAATDVQTAIVELDNEKVAKAGSTMTGPLVQRPAASVTPSNNGDMVFQLTSNTSLAVRVKGSDGVVRAVNLTLA